MKESEAKKIKMDQNMKTMEEALTATITQAVEAPVCPSGKARHCSGPGTTGNQSRGNHVSLHSGTHTLTHMGSRP